MQIILIASPALRAASVARIEQRIITLKFPDPGTYSDTLFADTRKDLQAHEEELKRVILSLGGDS